MSNFFEQNVACLHDENVANLLRTTESIAPDPTGHDDAALSIPLPNETLVFMLGFGDGFLANRIKQRMGKYQYMIIFEPDIARFKGALERRSFKRLFANASVRIVLGLPQDYGFVHAYSHTITNGVVMVIRDKVAVSGAYAKEYKEFSDKINEHRLFNTMNTGTQLTLGKSFANSLLRNAPVIARTNGISALKNIFSGTPAIIVSAGPSLERDVDTLRTAKGKALIITVDAALPFLLDHGVIPDIVTGIDPLRDNEALWKHRKAFSIPSIMLAQYTPTVFKKLKNLYVAGMPDNQIYAWLSRCWGDKGGLEIMGGSVSCFAYQVAEYLGCSSVAFVGLDLSFTSKYHVGNTAKLLHEHMGLEVPDDTQTGIRIKSRGKWVYTRETLLSFKTAFESRFRIRPVPYPVNCTKGGLKIEGTKEMPLASYIAKYGLAKDGDFSGWLMGRNGRDDSDMAKLSDEITKLRTIFTGITSTARKILPLIHDIKSLRESNKRKGVHALVKKIEALRPGTIHPALSLIVPYHYQLELYMARRDIREIDSVKSKWKKLDLQIDRGLNFYGELIEATELFNKELTRILRSIPSGTKEMITHERNCC